MGGVKGVRQNVLSLEKRFELRDCISQLERPFESWGDAVSYLSKVLKTEVTRRNIFSICEAAKIDITKVVKGYQKRMSVESLNEQVEELKRQVKELEVHVAALIEFRTSIES